MSDKHLRKFRSLGLLPKILLAILLGIGCSFFFPGWSVRIFLTFNSIFSNFLGLFIPLLIIGLVAPGIADLGKGGGKLLLVTVAIAYLSTIASGTFTLASCSLVYPSLLGDGMAALGDTDMTSTLSPYFTIEMPAFISVTSALVVAFILGLTAAVIEGHTMKDLLVDTKDIVTLIISRVIIPLLPLYIFGVFLHIGADGHIGSVLGMFLKIILFIILLHVTVLIAIFLIAGLVTKKNPFRALITMMPAYVTALGTASSAATIPVTLAQAVKCGVREETAAFTVPPVRNNPHTLQHLENHGILIRNSTEFRSAARLRHLYGLHTHGIHNHDCGSRSSRWRNHGHPGTAFNHVGLR